MKIRLALLITVSALLLSAFSLAERDTPPAYPAILETTPTTTPTLTQTPDPLITDPALTAIPTEVEVSIGTVSGKVVSGSNAALPSGLTVNLHGYDLDAASNANEVVTLTGTVAANGSYAFDDVEIPTGRIFLTEMTYSGVSYQSDYIIVDGTPVVLPDLTFYEVSTDTTLLSLDKVHVALDYSTEGILKIVEMYIIGNASNLAISIETDGTSIPFIQVPEGAQNLDFQVASGSSPFAGTAAGFALVPIPADQQYGLIAAFDLPYQKRMTLELPFSLPVTTLTLFVPEGVKVRGETLIDKGFETYSETNYQLYDVEGIQAGDTLTVKLNGLPTAATGTTANGADSNTQKWLIIGLGTGGMALIGVGLFLFIRDRRSKEEDEEIEELLSGELDGEMATLVDSVDAVQQELAETPLDKDALLDAIIALDDQFKAGGIFKSAYDKRRAELKAQLKKVV